MATVGWSGCWGSGKCSCIGQPWEKGRAAQGEAHDEMEMMR